MRLTRGIDTTMTTHSHGNTGRSRARTALDVGLALVVLAAVVPFAIYAVPQLVGADESYVVLSGSMEPAISAGDVVLVQRTDPRSIAVGDVVTFAVDGDRVPVTHRVVAVTRGITERTFVTKGDANEEADPRPVLASAVLGRVVLVVPYLGFVVTAVDTPVGFALLVVLPIGLLIVSEAWAAFGPSRDAPGIDAGASGLGGARTATGAEAAKSDPAASASTPADETSGPVDEAPEQVGDEAAGLTITAADLTVTSVVLGLFVAYAGAVAYLTRTIWSVMVLVGGASALLFALAVRVSAAKAATAGSSPDGSQPTGFDGPRDDLGAESDDFDAKSGDLDAESVDPDALPVPAAASAGPLVGDGAGDRSIRAEEGDWVGGVPVESAEASTDVSAPDADAEVGGDSKATDGPESADCGERGATREDLEPERGDR